MLVHQVAPGSEEGQSTSITPDLGPAVESERRSTQGAEIRDAGLRALRAQRRSISAPAAHHAQAHPPRVQ